MSKMKLYYSPGSPYARKVRILAMETKLDKKMEMVNVALSPVAPNADVDKHNPIGKIPTLSVKGMDLFDSPVICEYLDSQHKGRKLYPRKGRDRWMALRQQAMADGLLDAALLARYEGFLRPEDKRWPDWTKGQMKKIDGVRDALEAETKSFKGKLTIGQAIQIKSCGISFADVDLDNLNDKSLDKENSKEQFGSGGINSVSRLKYKDGTEKIFKPMQDDSSGAAVADHSGISKEDPHFENRNLTSHLVGKALGTNVIPEATVGIHNGRVGLMMELAKGREAANLYYDYKEAPQPQKIPKLQQQLMDLEWCDLLSGQMDRHNKNYLVDMSSDPPRNTPSPSTPTSSSTTGPPGASNSKTAKNLPPPNSSPRTRKASSAATSPNCSSYEHANP